MKKLKKIAVLTGGGDCPGINAVLRAVAKKAIVDHSLEVVGVEDGYEGLIFGKYRELKYNDVSGILNLGGTILGTSNKGNPFKYPVIKGKKVEYKDVSDKVYKNIKKIGADCLICIGGDGTLSVAYRLFTAGVPVIGIPKTIDNDIKGTDITFGFDSAVRIVTDGIDTIHTTAQSHHRIMIMEVMGRTAGWIALHSGVAGGGDIILIPEIPYDINVIAEKVKERSKKGKRFSIVVISEGAKPKGGDVTVKRMVKDGSEPVRLGGVGFVLGEALEKLTGLDTRTVVMGHLQRGGPPTPSDRILGTQLGSKAIDMAVKNEYGYMVGVKKNSFVNVSLKEVARGARKIPLNHLLLKSARSVGTCFGDHA